MTASMQNKQLLETAFAELATGNTAPFRELYADDVRYIMTGTTRWSKTYVGREQLRAELFGPLFELFDGPYKATASRFVAEGDLVVVEFRCDVTTRTGKPYRNSFCELFRFAHGKITEVTEYCDTALVNATL